MQTNKQIVDKFSKETGIKDPIVDTFIAMQDSMPDMSSYYLIGQNRMSETTYGIDPGHYGGWTFGVNNKQPSGDIYEEVVGGIWSEYFNKDDDRKKYFEGDWKWVERDGEKYLAKTVQRIVDNPRGRAILTGITPYSQS